MKNSRALLLKLAAKFQHKYADAQNLQEIIYNAAVYGETSSNGIMNFPAQLQKDQANLSINIIISSSLMGGTNISVSLPVVEPAEFAGNYTKLPDQIKKYLDRYIKDFPQITEGTYNLQYSGSSDLGVAHRS